MVTQNKLARARSVAPVYQLEIALNYSEPRIWRRVQVPGNANLGWLHAVIQLAMGWTNSHLLEALRNPKHADHKFLSEWLGRPFDSEAFDLAETNVFLQKLKWPIVTVGQQAKLLIARDDCRE